jgi:hypothetical protein
MQKLFLLALVIFAAIAILCIGNFMLTSRNAPSASDTPAVSSAASTTNCLSRFQPSPGASPVIIDGSMYVDLCLPKSQGKELPDW